MSNGMHRPLSDWIPVVGLPILWFVCFAAYYLRHSAQAQGSHGSSSQPSSSPAAGSGRTDLAAAIFAFQGKVHAALGLNRVSLMLVAPVLFLAAALFLSQGYFVPGGWLLLLGLFTSNESGLFAGPHEGPLSLIRSAEFLASCVACFGDLAIHLGYLYYYRDHGVVPLVVMASLIGTTVSMYIIAKGKILGFVPQRARLLPLMRVVFLGCGAALAPLLAFSLEPDAPHKTYHLAVIAIAVMALWSNVTAVRQIRHIMSALRNGPAKRSTGAHT